jgi:hypothetical protein
MVSFRSFSIRRHRLCHKIKSGYRRIVSPNLRGNHQFSPLQRMPRRAISMRYTFCTCHSFFIARSTRLSRHSAAYSDLSSDRLEWSLVPIEISDATVIGQYLVLFPLTRHRPPAGHFPLLLRPRRPPARLAARAVPPTIRLGLRRFRRSVTSPAWRPFARFSRRTRPPASRS